MEFLVNSADMGINGVNAVAESVGNFLVEQTLGEQLKNLRFARRESNVWLWLPSLERLNHLARDLG
jgi:hypothetical protein